MMQTRAASASHVAPKTGGFRAVRHMIAEVRAKEAEQFDPFVLNDLNG
jgi:ribosomal protein L29